MVSLSLSLSLVVVEGSGGGVSCHCSSARLQAALMASARVEVWLELRRFEDDGGMENHPVIMEMCVESRIPVLIVK